ncbi:Rhodanese-related sulfurtransferase [Paenibacillus uliginis N3/975]|uniref:Rhodanese-related sulfurtransferase n=1 Tax=Paenibacillus uliginis N3/975 TaxID=1313296 RepID=A0A1X7HH52_9BACL|nr:rhodanese-like domain-containing protein [Paenibacillus uliginis]SMF86073.1 Rhodanese-related sulfurtransferase [Paenibacillus uliginis N3/975]
MFFAYMIAAMLLVYAYRRWVPIHGLKLMKCSELTQAKKDHPNLKVLDVRDVSEYTACHLKESVNISLGRLPFVWDKELSTEDEVIIVTPNRSEGLLAARKLKKVGFKSLFYLTDDCHSCTSSR